MHGYCWLHDMEHRLNSMDDVCPRCLANKEQDLRWRADEESDNV